MSEHAQCALLFYNMPIVWNGLSMPTEGCSVCMFCFITNFKVRGVEQDSVPYMRKSPFQPIGMHIKQ